MKDKDAGDPASTQIGIVGPCTAGKSTLINRLRGRYAVALRHIAQEHSYVQDMWQRISRPDWLVFLDVSYPFSMKRKKLDWTVEEYQEQQRRLTHARQHADLYLMTDELTPEEVEERVREFLEDKGIQRVE